jgi:hypothetical protein
MPVFALKNVLMSLLSRLFTNNCFRYSYYAIFFNLNYAHFKGQSHEKVGEMRVEGDSLGPN